MVHLNKELRKKVHKLLSDFQLKSSRLAIHARIDVHNFSRFLDISGEEKNEPSEITPEQWDRFIIALHAELNVRRRWLERQHLLERCMATVKELEALDFGAEPISQSGSTKDESAYRIQIVNAIEVMGSVVGYDSEEANAKTNKQILPLPDESIQVVTTALETALAFERLGTGRLAKFSVVMILRAVNEVLSEFSKTLDELSNTLDSGQQVAKKSKDLARAVAAATIAIKALSGG